MFGRQIKLMCSVSFMLLLIAAASSVHAQDFDQVQIKTVELAGGVYMLVGSGGNIGVLRGPDGVFMIDDQYAPLTEKIKAAIAEICEHSVRFVLNTHWHGDHVGGNEKLGEAGAVIVAHENVRKRMSTDQFIEAFNSNVPPSPKMALPVITFAQDVKFHLNGHDIHVFHVKNAHTDGDAVVYFPKANAVHTGDIYFAGTYPFIDLSSGGSIDGIIAAANRILSMIDDETKVIPGHGSLSNKKEMQTYLGVLTSIRDRISKHASAGKSLEEVLAAKPTQEYDADWGNGFVKPDQFVKILYADLSRDKE